MTTQFEMSAEYYDIFYSQRRYRDDVAAIETLLKDVLPPDAAVLDVACGSHEHAQYFNPRYQIDGLDNNQTFLDIASAKNRQRPRPGGYHLASMDAFVLGRRYDAILCLFSSIGYLPDTAALQNTIQCFSDHLAPGGVILIEPWLAPDAMDSFPAAQVVTQRQTSIARIARHRIDGDKLTLWLHYLTSDNAGVQYFVEEHKMSFFSADDYRRAFDAAGLTLEFDPIGLSSARGLYVCRKRVTASQGRAMAASA